MTRLLLRPINKGISSQFSTLAFWEMDFYPSDPWLTRNTFEVAEEIQGVVITASSSKMVYRPVCEPRAERRFLFVQFQFLEKPISAQKKKIIMVNVENIPYSLVGGRVFGPFVFVFIFGHQTSTSSITESVLIYFTGVCL
ncbi:hypothetical protein CEXT_294271 [Caerostris extrusa]|uniref:Uncharacterized protein n=1 Tax=Caerostris extrusa TaxID=172846 RepID=A0AAV4NPB4_CAEEX|nr:hypothetical protein CEXT_294271 [Caerostris extrusa]